MFAVAQQFLDVNFVIVICSNSNRSMTGWMRGLVTRFEQAIPLPVLWMWCGLHQIALVMQKLYVNAID